MRLPLPKESGRDEIGEPKKLRVYEEGESIGRLRPAEVEPWEGIIRREIALPLRWRFGVFVFECLTCQ